MKKNIISLFAILSIVIFATGCATSNLQTNAAMTRTIVLDPVAPKDKTIYMQVKNTAASKINLEPDLKKDLIKNGYRIIDDPNKAKYLLHVNVLFADNLKEAQAIKAATDAGVTTGLAVGIGNSSGKSGIIAGVAAALIGGAIGAATEDEIYRAVIDISVKEKKNQPIRARHSISEEQAQAQNNKIAGFGNEISGEALSKTGGSSLKDGLGTDDTYDFTTNYIQHKTRVIVTARKMNLDIKEAIPLLQKKAAYEISQIF